MMCSMCWKNTASNKSVTEKIIDMLRVKLYRQPTPFQINNTFYKYTWINLYIWDFGGIDDLQELCMMPQLYGENQLALVEEHLQ